MGIAKKKMFGHEKSSKWQTFVERGTLLSMDIDYAYLQKQKKSPLSFALHAALLASAREGHLCLEKRIIEDPLLASLLPEGRYYLPKYEEVENQIVHHVKRLFSYPQRKKHPLQIASMTEKQLQAIDTALTYSISCITGGPGTGKTYTAAQIACAYPSTVIVTAPTGKATFHLAKQIKRKVLAKTLHSLLQEEEKLEAALVIVDECSMIGPFVFARLLSAIGPDTTLVLMGDVNQLAAIEGGNVFADLIDSKKIPTTYLTKCIRSDRKEILELAEKILQGKTKDIHTIDLGFTQGRVETIYQHLWHYVKDKDFSKFRILSTLRKGPLGVDAMNRYLYEKFSLEDSPCPIMIMRNDPTTLLANGEVGLLYKNKAIFDERSFHVHELPSFEYAYCISVHKSQGSEYEDVLFLIPDGSENFGREILYTGVTRAKSFLAIAGNPVQIAAALKRNSKKISGICEKIASLKNAASH